MTRRADRLIRMGGWVLNLGAGSALWIGLGARDDRTGLAILLVVTVGLAMEAGLLIIAQIVDRPKSPEPPPGARAADGVVEVWEMAGVLSRETPEAAPWKEYVGCDLTDPSSGELHRHVRDRFDGNPPLLGRVALISVFVGRDGRSWTSREIKDAHRALRLVGEWVEREAIRWVASVNIGLADTYFRADDDRIESVEVEFVPEGDEFGPMEADATTKSIAGASRVAAQLGFTDVVDMVARINPKIEADAHVWLWHLKQRGRSHAIPAGDRVIDGGGLAICYARESSFPEPLTGPGSVDPVTVAHELMHLFGALDKYGVPLDTFRDRDVRRSDIMRLDDGRLLHLQMGRLTALEVGWPDSQAAGKRKNPPLGNDREAGLV